VIPLSFSELWPDASNDSVVDVRRCESRIKIDYPISERANPAGSTQVAHHALKGCRCNRSDTEFEAW
jgi:hypothetical protein